MIPILNETPQTIFNTLLSWEEGPHRAKRLNKYLYQDHAEDFGAMPDLRRDLRLRLKSQFALPTLTVDRHLVSGDGTEKFSFRLMDDAVIETVLIPAVSKKPGARALCVSTQAGCAVGCVFCCTGLMGLKRNLKAWEILEQIRFASRHLGTRPTHIVFMGMGEPLHNFEEMKIVLETLTHPLGFNMKDRRITVSTIGVYAKLKELIETTDVQIGLSLHATTDELRKKLIPNLRHSKIVDLIALLRQVPRKDQARFMVEYVLLDGINDSTEDAAGLAALLEGIRCQINLIPYNEIPGLSYHPTSTNVALAFRDHLRDAGLSATIRRPRGQDILGACGQLAE